MPARKQKNAQKTEQKSEEPQVPNDEILQIINDIDRQVQEKAEHYVNIAAEMTQALRCVFQIQLLKLPKQVRNMRLKEFKERFGGDINSVLLGDLEERMQASIAAAAPSTSLRTRATQVKSRARGLETPAFSQESVCQPATVMREPKLGETFYSQNGSPIGVLEPQPGSNGGLLRTVLKSGLCSETPLMLPAQNNARGSITSMIHKGRPASRTGVADGILITLKDGNQITVDIHGGLEGVPPEHRKEAAAHLQALEKLARSALSTQRHL